MSVERKREERKSVITMVSIYVKPIIPTHLPERTTDLSISTDATWYNVLGRGLIVVQAVAPVVIFSVDERGA